MAEKIYTYTFILLGLSMLLALAGFQTGMGLFLDYLGIFDLNTFQATGGNFLSSNYYIVIGALFVIGTIGVAASFFARTSPIPFIVAGFVAVLATFVMDFINVITYSSGAYPDTPVVTIILSLIFIPLAGGYLLSLINFWSGSD